MNLEKQIKKIAKSIYPQVIEWRRHIHANPELSFEEFETANFIEEQLKSLGFTDVKRLAKTGVIADLKGAKAGRTIALRADIDALPIQEQNDKPYKSKVPNTMHACGHDVHSASLLGVAAILQQLKAEIKGTIRLIFQPGEELLPGGASILIKEGVLENPKPDLIIGQHVHPPLAAGKVGFCAGNYMASADEIYLTIEGKGGHAAIPQNNIDPIIITANILISLQQIISRRNNPATPSVLSFGKINSEGGATNVIPDKVYIQGTFRTFDEEWRLEAHKLIENQIQLMAQSMGGNAIVDIRKGYPVLHNNSALTTALKKKAAQLNGESQVVQLPIRLSSEDFAFYSHEIPACFYRLGTGNVSKGITSGVHTPTFDIDESALLTSIETMSYLAISAGEQNLRNV